ncbi:alpha/beta hydrolase [Pararhodobacter sp. SW119]|uniref:alpha/beta fold hydrolase n=1 Tax=Pararhodobacter sp. SW119 TaxID=2780075 RepID=UPI001ADF4C04|nr:alpha/beta hydrolase [Pararhodobacter sp. SW119]
MESLKSTDGTQISFARSGDGPPLVLVHGTTSDHTRWVHVLPGLEKKFSVIAMERRGRGESGDAAAYSLEQEYEDVATVAMAMGPGTSLLGHSYGALCAMEAALRLDNIRKLVLYEPPFPIGDAPVYPPGLDIRLRAMLADDEREKLLITFLSEVAGISAAQLAAMRADPSWEGRVRAAHTALREMVAGEYRFDPARFRRLAVPTLLLLGEASPIGFTAPTRALDAALPDSRIVILEGQGHAAMSSAPDLFVREVISFLSA